MPEQWERDVSSRMERAKAELGLPDNAPSQPRYANPSRRGWPYAKGFAVGVASTATLLSLISGSISPVQWAQNEAAAVQLCSNPTNHSGLTGCVGSLLSRHATPVASVSQSNAQNGQPSAVTPSSPPLPSSPTPLPPAPTPAGQFLSDGFDGERVTAQPKGWTVTDGWTIATEGGNGYAHVSGAESGSMTAGSPTWTNVVGTATLRRDATQSGVHLALRSRDLNNYYACGVSLAGHADVTIMVNGVETHFGLNGPVKNLSQETGAAQPVGSWFSTRFTVVGNKLSCTVNGAGTIAVTDSTFSAGAVGLITFGPASIDDVTVSSS